VNIAKVEILKEILEILLIGKCEYTLKEMERCIRQRMKTGIDIEYMADSIWTYVR